jgi:Tissue inhibitor of metalloproteinase
VEAKVKRLLVACVLAVSGIAFAAPPCLACSCAPGTKKGAAESADFVFTGRVNKIVHLQQNDSGGPVSGTHTVRVRFRVSKVYKGWVREFANVYTTSDGASCGYHFTKGEKYTVFAYKSGQKKWTGTCNGTKKGGIDHEKYGLPPGHPPAD